MPFRFDCVLANGIECVSFISQDADNFDHYWVVVDEDQCPWHEKFLTGDDDLWLQQDPYPLAELDRNSSASSHRTDSDYAHHASNSSDDSDEGAYTSDEEIAIEDLI